ncbi:hypothetical protein MUY27_20130 [Mucilaginibacter sp. RS28]|uniref:Uncharacterized protein n=1 Tax=Mucilaginibacter straminoryzae TaxID=2932774 RepID=A0A9X1X6W5_9SPHI|nr:hypothetical protein [Mucilaginibacter straminoryzae]MCJ8212036.1 hypothetical protein [Mucilaginibacter straminoryzae]
MAKNLNKHFLAILLILFTHISSYAQPYWGRTLFSAGDGVTEVGKYFDFHESTDDPLDYSIRLWSSNNKLYSSGHFYSPGLGINTSNTSNGSVNIFGNSISSTNLILSANYENSYRWRFITTDRGNAIDLDITASNYADNQQTILKLSPVNSGRPSFILLDNWLVANNGNVGIGTTQPDQKLTVNGTIHASQVKVDTNIPTPDYVFNADYKLASLSKVQDYINRYHHLPEIPNAQQ